MIDTLDWIPRAYASFVCWCTWTVAFFIGGASHMVGYPPYVQGCVIFCGWPWVTVFDTGTETTKNFMFLVMLCVWFCLITAAGSAV